MIWYIERAKPDGTAEYVSDMQQDAGSEPYRFLSTDDVCTFNQPGKYTVYLLEKSEYDSHHGKSDNYLGKAVLTVQ